MDKIFRVGILVLTAFFLYIFYNNSQNKRFEYQLSHDTFTVFDNRTGIIRTLSFGDSKNDKPKTVLFDLMNARVEVKEIIKK